MEFPRLDWERRGGWGDKYISSYISFLYGKSILILFFLNKIINDPPPHLIYRSFLDKCIMSQYDLRFSLSIEDKIKIKILNVLNKNDLSFEQS